LSVSQTENGKFITAKGEKHSDRHAGASKGRIEGGGIVDSTFFAALLGLSSICFLCLFGGCLCGDLAGQKDGYIQCLQDIKKGNPPAYVLVEQPDGSTAWQANKEKGK
jgi:hypothetical protein